MPFGGRQKVAAEGGFRVVMPQRRVPLPLIAGQQRPVVGQHTRKQRDAKQHAEDPQADVAAPMPPEALPGARCRRGRGCPSLRARRCAAQGRCHGCGQTLWAAGLALAGRAVSIVLHYVHPFTAPIH